MAHEVVAIVTSIATITMRVMYRLLKKDIIGALLSSCLNVRIVSDD